MADMKDMALNIYVNAQTVKLKQFNRELNNTKNKIKDVEKTSTVFGGLFKFAGAYIGIRSIIQGVTSLVRTTSNLQLMQASIEGLTKSTQDWQYVQDEAFRTGTRVEAVARGYKNFYSSATMAGFDKKSIQGMYSDILTASRAIGASQEQTSGALLALEQMISKGTVSMEELRRQLGNALPGAFEIGAKAMNMTTKEFNEFVKTGKLASTEFVPKFIKTLIDTYGGGFEKITKTTDFALGQLGVAWQQFQVEIMTGETGEALAKGLNELTRFIKSPEFKNFAKLLGEIFTIVIKLFTFVIRNSRTILLILGIGGFYGLLGKNVTMMRLLNMEISRSIALLFRMGRMGKLGFGGMSMATKGFLTALMRILFPLMVIEDLIFGIGHFLLGWDVGSVMRDIVEQAPTLGKNIGDLIKINKDPYGITNLNLPKELTDNSKNFERYKNAIRTGNSDVAKKLLKNPNYKPTANENAEMAKTLLNNRKPITPLGMVRDFLRGVKPFTGTSTGMAAPLSNTSYNIPESFNTTPMTAQNAGYVGTLSSLGLNKTETETKNISIGDINIVIQGNIDPNATAMAVRNELSNLFLSSTEDFA